jgi:Mn2+/Fe2+ NRAMP family transporter
MGEHTNSAWFNWVAWITAAIVIGLSLVMMWNQMHGG